MAGTKEHPKVLRREQIYRPWTLRFIPEGDEVPRILIHLLSRIFHRQASRLQTNKVSSHDCHVGFHVSSTIEVLHHRRLISLPVCDVISVTIHSQLERLVRLTYILKATPPARN